MTISGSADQACVELGVDPAVIEERYFSGKDRVEHEYKAGDVCQHQDLPVYYLVRETSYGDGNRLEWVVTEQVWDQMRDAR